MNRLVPRLVLDAFFVLGVSTPAVFASSGTWLGTSGDWSNANTALWSGGTIADGTNATANFTGINITANQSITLNTDPRTIGNIIFTDQTTASNNLTISGSNLLTLDVTTGKPAISVTQSGRTLTISSVIAGNDGLQKDGAGTLVLDAISDSFTGDISINAGTLQVGSNGTAARLGAGTYSGNISNNGTLLQNNNQNQTFSGIISGAGTMQKSGSGTLTLTGSNTYTGKTIIAATGAGGPTLSISSLNSVNGGTPLLSSSSIGAPMTIADGTIQLGSSGNTRSCALAYTGSGETTDRILSVQFNSGAKHTVNSSGSGLLKFTSPFTITPSSGTTGGGFTVRGTGSGEIAEMGTIPGIFEKLDAGTWTILNAVNTTPTNAPIKVTAGTLVLRKGSFGHIGTTTVSANASLVHYASSDAPLLVAGPLDIAGGTSTTIGASIGSSVDSARIDVAGNATTNTAAVRLNLYGNTFSTSTDGSETYTLIQGGGINTLSNAAYSLGTVFNASGFTAGAIHKSADTVTVDITQVPLLATAHWKGTATAGLTKVWAASNGSAESNWSDSSGGAVQALVPGATTDVIISASAPAVAPIGTTLGADMSIRSLTISDTTNGLSLNTSVTDSYGLTLGAGGMTMNAGVPASLIAVPLVLGGDQTWTNTSANPLTISGPVSGVGSLTKNGSGAINLTGSQSFAGDLTVGEGVISLSGPKMSAAAKVAIASGAMLALNFTGSVSVSYLIVDGAALPAGTYNATTTSASLSGTGNIIVTVTDTDVDGIPDSWMNDHFGHPTGQANDLSRAGDDADSDGLNNLDEFQNGTNPKVADSDNDGLSDGVEVNVRHTTPLIADTDGDGLNDGVEVNTHHTDPLLADSDVDALTDGQEVNTYSTNPLSGDTDNDGAGDWYEIYAAFTNPNLSSSKPGVSYPLPKPDNTPPVTNKPVKVFILMGQSNMQGKGDINSIGTPGTLATVVKQQNKFPNLTDINGNWSSRADVKYRGVISCIGKADLAVGQGTGATQIGPELGFGHLMGYHFDEPVIVIKASYGGQDLGFDFLPPGSQRYTVNGTTYAGYLDTARKWTAGGSPPPQYVPGTPTGYLANPVGGVSNYAGKMFDDCVSQVNGILSNFSTEYPQYAAQGYQIAGVGWFQGWNDSVNTTFPERYEMNMANFITAFRNAVNAPDVPFVIASCGFDGLAAAGGQLAVINAQLNIGNPALHPEFNGKVKTMDTRGYWRTIAESPVNQGYHYHHNCETYLLVGDAIARGMIELMPTTPPANTYANWIAGYPSVPPGLAGFDQDADGDGIDNGAENFFGTNPGIGNAGLISGAAGANSFTFTHPQNATPATGVTAAYRWSKDLATFRAGGANDGAGTTVNFNAVTNAGITTVTATVTGTSTARLFVDVKVSQN